MTAKYGLCLCLVTSAKVPSIVKLSSSLVVVEESALSSLLMYASTRYQAILISNALRADTGTINYRIRGNAIEGRGLI